jgi:hypothetical protein
LLPSGLSTGRQLFFKQILLQPAGTFFGNIRSLFPAGALDFPPKKLL